MGLGKFLSDILGRVISNILVFGITALIIILAIKYVIGIDVIGFSL